MILIHLAGKAHIPCACLADILSIPQMILLKIKMCACDIANYFVFTYLSWQVLPVFLYLFVFIPCLLVKCPGMPLKCYLPNLSSIA